jgi:hypothetical protein
MRAALSVTSENPAVVLGPYTGLITPDLPDPLILPIAFQMIELRGTLTIADIALIRFGNDRRARRRAFNDPLVTLV